MEIDDESLILVAGSKKAPLVCQLSSYKEMKLIDVRKYFTNKSSGELIATKKGVSLTRIQYEALSEVFQEKNEIIESWFDSSQTMQETNAKSLQESRLKSDEYKVEISEWKGSEMSRYEQVGSVSVLKLNQNHPWIMTLLTLIPDYRNNETFLHICSLMQAHHKAQNLIDSKNLDALEISETIEANWGLYSKISGKVINNHA
jgi:hypothetical protein